MNITLPKTVFPSQRCGRQLGEGLSVAKTTLLLVILISSLIPSLKAQDLSLQTSPVAFGNVCVNSTQGNNFIIAGNSLSTADIIISSLAGFSFATNINGPYTNGLTITGHGGGNLSITVYVRFSPIAVASYDGTIDISGGGDPTNLQATLSGAGAALPVIAVTPAAPTICNGSGTSLTASGAATYSWSPATGLSATSGAIVTASPAATRTYTVTGTDAIGCTSTADVTVTVNPLTNPSVSIGADYTNICAGSQVLFTATPLDAGVTPTYQWQISTDGGTNYNNISGATAVTYSTTTLANNDKIRVVMTPDVLCPSTPTDVSNVLTITVNPVLTATVSIVPANTYAICAGATATFTSSVTNGGPAPGYQWQLSTDGGANFSNIASATSAGYSGTFNHNDQVRLVLTSNGTCVIPAVVPSVATTITVSTAPTAADAGPDQAICGATTTTATLAGNTIASGTGTWTLVSSTGSTPSITSPSNPASGITGLTTSGIYIFQWTSTNSPCTASFDQVTITVSDAASAASAGPDQVVCGISSTSLAATAITTPSTGLWTVVSGTPAPTISVPSSRTSTFTGTPGSTYVLRWSVTNGSCVNTDDVQVSFVGLPTPSFSPAPATDLCLNGSVIYSTQGGAGINDYNWSIPGVAGTDYNITGGSIANTSNTVTIQWLTTGSKTVTVNYKNASDCSGASAASATTVVNAAPALSLGSAAGSNNQTICGGTASLAALTYNVTGSTNVTVSGLPAGLAGSLSGSTYTISKNGNVVAGTYNYTVTALALAGCSGSATAIGTITVFTGNPGFPGSAKITGPNGHCPLGQITLTVDPANNTQLYKWYVEGNELPSNGWIIVSGGGTTSITIQSTGAVSYAANANTFSVTAVNPCGVDPINSSRHIELNVSTFNGITAGNDFTICEGSTINLSGTLQGAATSGSWSLISGTGSLGVSTTTGTTVTASFTPTSGAATLRITSDDASGTCNTAVTDDMIVTVAPTATASFGTTITVCEGNSGTLTINGTPNAVVNYTRAGTAQTAVTLNSLGTASISTGVLTTNTDFQLTSVGYSTTPNCTQILSSPAITVTVNLKAIVAAGTDITVCGNVADVQLSGNFSGSASAAVWSGGGGSFSPATSTLNATYTPTPAEITAGSVTLYLTATAGFVAPCQATQDTITIFFSPAPTVYAGADREQCQQITPAAISLSDATRGGSASNATWSVITGSGTLSNPSATTTPGTVTFTPATGFSGLVQLRLVTNDPAGVCVAVADTVDISITALPTVNVGADVTVCSNSTVPATAALGGTAVSGNWSSTGNGSFNNASAASAVYTLGTNDINNGSVTLTFTSNDPAGDCTAASDAFTITIKDSVHISSNPVNVGLCAGTNTSFTVLATGDDLLYQWYKGTAPGGAAVTNGGNINGATSAQLSFSPATSANDGTYYLVVSANNPNCASKTSTAATLNVDESILISAQPTAQTVCENASVSFTVSAAAGTDVLTYQWRRNGSDIAGATAATYTTTATLAAQGNYDVVISGSPGYTCPNITSSAVALTVTPTVGTPGAITVSAGTEPTCQLTNGTTTTTYAATATNSTALNWSLSNSSAGSIDAATGVVTWTNGFSGSVDIRVTASGCNGPSAQVIRSVTITPTVGTPTAITISGTEPTCQLTNGTTTTTYATTATNNTGFNWSLSNAAAGSINASSGVMTWANGFSGSVDIRVTANGCNSPSSQVIHSVTINPTVGTPTAITFPAGTEPTCQLTNGTTTTAYATTATNNTGFNWTINNVLAGSIDATTGVMSWANGFTGSVDIRVTASGCNGPSSQVVRSVTLPVSVGTPVFAAGATSTRCQSAASITYGATATASTSISYSLDATTLAFGGNSINSGTGAVTFVAGWNGTSVVTATAQGCNGPTSSTHSITTDANSVGGTLSPALKTVCSTGDAGVITLSGNIGNVEKWQSSINGGVDWADSLYTTTTLNYSVTTTTLFRAVIKNGTACPVAYSSGSVISVIPAYKPNPVIATPATICRGQQSVLTAQTGYQQTGIPNNSGNFQNANPSGWCTTVGNAPRQCTGDFLPANGDNTDTGPWRETNPHTFSGVAMSSPNPKFAIANGPFNGFLETPVFSLIAQPSATLNFLQGYIINAGASAKIEISTDGGANYTVLQQYNPVNSLGYSPGPPQSLGMQAASLDLSNYLGLANLRLRFNYAGSVGSAWILDNVTVPGTLPITYTWVDTSLVPTTLTPVTQTPLTVLPAVTTTYTITTYVGGCLAGSENVTVYVNMPPSVELATTGPVCAAAGVQTINLPYNNALFGPNRYSIVWDALPANTFAPVNNAVLPASPIQISVPANHAAGTFTGRLTVRNSSTGCDSTGIPFSITINPRPTATVAGAQSICIGASATITINVPSTFGSVTGTLSDGTVFSGSGTITVSVTPSTTTTYTLATMTNGTCASLAADLTGSHVVTVNGMVSITAQPVTVKVCVGAATTFTAGHANATNVRWQRRTSSTGAWVDVDNLIDGGIYSGYTSPVLTVGAVPAATALTMIDYEYKLLVGNSCNNLETNIAKLQYNYIWTGNVSIDWNNINNWAAFEVPTLNCPDVYLLGNRSFEPTLSTGADGTVFNLHILPNADFTQLNGNMMGAPGIKLQVAGHIFKDPVSTYNALDGTLEMFGSAAQDIDALTFTNDDLENLIVNSTGNLTLDGPVDIYESVTFGTKAVTLNTNGHLTLKSLPARTARLGTMNTGNQDVNGDATVERYLRPRMAWRFLAIPTSGGQTINQAWQEGATVPDANPSPGYGTQITGPVVANGIDAYTINPSMKAFNSSTYLWDGEANTHVPIEDRRGYMLFVRGDRSAFAPTCETCPQPTVMETTLRTKGTFYKGLQLYNLTPANDWLSVGNPFASQVDLRLVAKTGGLVNAFTVWDSYPLGNYWVGAYQTLVWQGGNYVNVSKAGMPVQNHIESGQAFFIQSDNAGSANLAIREADKTDGSVNVSFAPPRTTKPEVMLWAKLMSAPEGQPVGMVDGLLLNFDNDYSRDIDKMDVKKFFSAANNLSVLSKGFYLVAERTAYPTITDSIQLILSSTAQQGYQLEFEPTKLEKLGVKPYLHDRYLDKYHPIAANTLTSVPFTISAAAGSRALNRFRIVFKKPASVDLDIRITEALRNADRTIVVSWSAVNGQQIEKYELERSADGRLFSGIITTPAEKNEAITLYSKTDIGPLAGDNYYRIKAVRSDGVLIFSEIVKVAADQPGIANKGTITVYPNPVSGKKMRVEFKDQEEGRYQLQLINALGQVAQRRVLMVDRNISQHEVMLGAAVKPGQYQLSITAPNGSKTIQTLFIEH